MTIKTAAEMFGDGSGGNPQVPIDLNSPPGYNANNRGVAFGEQVTSAIKNRTPYSLVLNDEDLNTRLAPFETTGLDAAYRLGTVASAGGGRVITVDGGAVETQSAFSSLGGDQTHYRANALSDSEGGGILFEARTRRAWAGAASGPEPYAGYADLILLAWSSGYSILTESMTGQLNPGGAGTALFRLDVGPEQFSDTGKTNLVLNVDLLEISGSAAHDGLYKIATTPADDDVTLTYLDGSAPTFSISEAVTVRALRVRFGSFGWNGNQNYQRGLTAVGSPGYSQALSLLPATSEGYGTSPGSNNALVVYHKDLAGELHTVLSIDEKGSIFSQQYAGMEDSMHWFDTRHYGHYVAGRNVDYSDKQRGVGFYVYGGVTGVTHRYDFLSQLKLDVPAIGLSEGSQSCQFQATSPTEGRILLSGADPDLAEFYLPPYATWVRFSSPGDAFGTYLITGIETGPDAIIVRNLDGTLPNHLPTGGVLTGTFFFTQTRGRLPNITYTGPLAGNPTDPIHAYNVMSIGGEDDAVALAMFGSGYLSDRHFIRAFAQDTYELFEMFSVSNRGVVKSYGDISSGRDVLAVRDVHAQDDVIAEDNIWAVGGWIRSNTSYVRGVDILADNDVIASGATSEIKTTGNASSIYASGLNASVKADSHVIADADGANGGHFLYGDIYARLVEVTVPLSAGFVQDDWSMNASDLGNHYLAAVQDYGDVFFPLSQIVRTDCRIHKIKVSVKPGAVRSGTARMQATLYVASHDWGTSTAESPLSFEDREWDNGLNTNTQWITLDNGGAGLDYVVNTLGDFGKDVFLEVRAGSNGGQPATRDVIYGLQVQFYDKGPRNW